jgi:hypothetical protein
MRAKQAFIVLGALMLMANGANAQHRTGSQTHVRNLSRVFEQAYGYAPPQMQPFQSSSGVYGAYPRPSNNNLNPDFQLGGER